MEGKIFHTMAFDQKTNLLFAVMSEQESNVGHLYAFDLNDKQNKETKYNTQFNT